MPYRTKIEVCYKTSISICFLGNNSIFIGTIWPIPCQCAIKPTKPILEPQLDVLQERCSDHSQVVENNVVTTNELCHLNFGF